MEFANKLAKPALVAGLAFITGVSVNVSASTQLINGTNLEKSIHLASEKLKDLNLVETTQSMNLPAEVSILGEAIRKQLYFNEADPVTPDEEVPAEDTYSRDRAAFRYLDLMYSLDDNSGSVINKYISGTSPADFSSLFDTAERNRVSDVEAQLYEQLRQYPANESLQNTLLDLYYDRAVAEIVQANIALDKALASRLNDEVIAVEIGYVNEAYELLSTAFQQYIALLESTPVYLQQWAGSRGEISPRYYDPSTGMLKDVAPSTSLSSEYKDIAMLYQLMEKLASVKVQQVRLAIMSGVEGSSSSAELIEEVNALHSNLTFSESALRALFPEIDFTQLSLDTGLPQAVTVLRAKLFELEVSKSWFKNDSNFLGVAWGAIPQGFGRDADTFNALIESVGGENGKIVKAQESHLSAKAGFDGYQHRPSFLAQELVDRNQELRKKLTRTLGVTFPVGCYEVSCGKSYSLSRADNNLFSWRRNANSVQTSLKRNLDRLGENLHTIESEVKLLALNAGVNDGLTKIRLDYGPQQTSLAQRIEEIRVANEGFNSRIALFGSLVSAIDDYYKGSWIDVDSLLVQVKEVEKTIGLLGDFEQLSIMNATLAAELRANMLDSTGNMLTDGDLSRLQNLWLEINSIAFEVAQAEMALLEESKRLPVILNKAKVAIAQFINEKPDLAFRHYPNLVNSRRSIAALMEYENDYKIAQQWLFHAVSALENKWQHKSFEKASGISKEAVFRLRSINDLWAFHEKMLKLKSRIVIPETYKDTFSIREDVFGYKDFINGVQQTYLHPDPNKQNGLRLSAIEAFREKLRLISQSLGDEKYVTIEFSTVKERASVNFFNGPIISGWGTDSACIAVGGSYSDKIKTVELSIPVSYDVSGELETPAYLTYGGAGVYREDTPGTDIVNDAGDFGVEGELNSYSVSFWDITGNSYVTPFGTAQSIWMKAGLSLFGNDPSSGNTVTNVFNGQNVAATGWRLSFLLEDIYGKVVDINAINDVELIFEHNARSRNYSDCTEDSQGGPL
ncbi:hypothetical protein ACJJH9_01780 [Microbulbifer sp. DLAB2-AF]|uniref:hypothetical protein n=1 Tax=Microbulbifer sp. DLAB2-AF TaxID=3243395 RepID=UPI00403A508A